jgi:hypothetical protein
VHTVFVIDVGEQEGFVVGHKPFTERGLTATAANIDNPVDATITGGLEAQVADVALPGIKGIELEKLETFGFSGRKGLGVLIGVRSKAADTGVILQTVRAKGGLTSSGGGRDVDAIHTGVVKLRGELGGAQALTFGEMNVSLIVKATLLAAFELEDVMSSQ